MEEEKLSEETPNEILEVFDYYVSVFRTRVRLTPLKKKKIAARLKAFKKEELFRAIDNLSKSPFHNGMNERGTCYNSIEFLFRSDDKTEEWVNKYSKPADGHARLLGDALIANYKISYKRHLDHPVVLTIEDEQALYHCASKILDAGFTQYHVPQAFMLAFFLLDKRNDKSVAGFVNRLPWLMTVAPVCKERALTFARDLLRVHGETALPTTTSEALKLLERSGLTYD